MHPKPADGKWHLGRSESTREEKADPVQMGAGSTDGTGQPQRLGEVLHRMSPPSECLSRKAPEH